VGAEEKYRLTLHPPFTRGNKGFSQALSPPSTKKRGVETFWTRETAEIPNRNIEQTAFSLRLKKGVYRESSPRGSGATPERLKVGRTCPKRVRRARAKTQKSKEGKSKELRREWRKSEKLVKRVWTKATHTPRSKKKIRRKRGGNSARSD